MSIDIHVPLRKPIFLRPFLSNIAKAVAEMFDLVAEPILTLECLEDGKRLQPANDSLLFGSNSLYFLINIAGEPECVGLLSSSGDWVGIVMAAQRTTLEYALGAAIAIALAREMSEQIEDDWRFFSSAVYISPEDLMKTLKVPGPNRDCRSASDRLVIRGNS